MTSGTKIDCAVVIRGLKLATEAIWFAEFEDGQKSQSADADQGKWDPQQQICANSIRWKIRQHHCVEVEETKNFGVGHFFIRGL